MRNPILPQTTKALRESLFRLHLSSYELDLDLICISCQPVPICPATLAQSGSLCQWHGPPPSHRPQFAHTTCESHQHGTGSSLMTRAISVILKIHIDPRCSTFITCCSHLHHAGLCAPSWFGFHVLFVFSPRFMRTHTMKWSDKSSERQDSRDASDFRLDGSHRGEESFVFTMQ